MPGSVKKSLLFSFSSPVLKTENEITSGELSRES
jgi:hypothetical protein